MNNNNISLIYKLLTTTTTMVLRDVRDMGKQQKGPSKRGGTIIVNVVLGIKINESEKSLEKRE